MGTKLGLKIVRTSQGLTGGYTANDDKSWSKSVRDTRDDVKVIPGLSEDSNASAIMYSATGAGEFYTIISMIPGRPGDFISAWIYLPQNINISGRELIEVIDGTKKEILATEINPDTLDRIFSKEYGTNAVAKSCTPTSGVGYAVRYCGAYYSLEEMLNIGLSQADNSNYKSIFLIDHTSGLKAVGCKDLTDVNLKESFVIKAPSNTDGFTPYLNGNVFSDDIRVTTGERINVIWKKDGYDSISKTTVIAGKDSRIDTIYEGDYLKQIRYSDIVVKNEVGAEIREPYTLRINNQTVEEGEYASVREAMLKEVKVSVSNCRGYNSRTVTLDFTANKRYKITLAESSYTYTFVLPLRDNLGSATIEVESREELEHNPIEGYRSVYRRPPVQGDKNYLEYKPAGGGKKSIILIALALVLGLLLGGIATALLKNKEINTLKEQITEIKNPTKPQENRPSSMAQAKTYLTHPVWNKDEMEEIADLRGLWDMVNEHRFDDIKKLESKFGRSGNFGQLLSAIDQLKEKGGSSESFPENYNRDPNDHEITMVQVDGKKGYIKTLQDKAEELAKKTTTKPSSDKPTGNSQKNEETSGGKSEDWRD